MSGNAFSIRAASPADAHEIARLIDGLAAYERLAHESKPDPEAIRRHLDPASSPRCDALLAFADGVDRPIGFALFFYSYSTFLTRFGLYLEDLFVEPAFRGRGIGKALLSRVVDIARENECGRVEWSVLDWNEDAIGFYLSLGAIAMDEWTTMRLAGDALRRFPGR
jgi:diamine N-acetyltransferase